MNEVQAIIEAFDESQSRGEASALATVVSIEGSAYRRPGARMLVTQSGASTGKISAGCLESDVIEHAQQVIKSTWRNSSSRHDPTSEEIVWVGLGCTASCASGRTLTPNRVTRRLAPHACITNEYRSSRCRHRVSSFAFTLNSEGGAS